MKARLFIFYVVCLLFTGCAVNGLDNVVDEIDSFAPVFTCSLPISTSDTKTYVDDNLNMYWNANDRVSIFINTYNQQYKFTGETGDNAGVFAKIKSDEFVTGNALSCNYGVYPYNSATKISYDGQMTLEIPAVQNYAVNSFGLGANTMVAVTENIDDNFLMFKNVCGYLVINLYGNASIKELTLKGNDGERIAGQATCTPMFGEDPSIEMGESAIEMITLDCGDGVALGKTKEDATAFWFVVPPTTFSNGFTISYTTLNDITFEKSVSSSKAIVRNRVNRMGALECREYTVPAQEYVDLGLSVLWTVCNVGADKPEDVGYRLAWGETEPKSFYDWSNYKWCNGTYRSLTKYCSNSSYGTVDDKIILDAKDDAATVHLGPGYRTPAVSELTELKELCTWTVTTLNDVAGYNVTGPNGNSIFIPFNGQYDESGLHWPTTGLSIWANQANQTYLAYDLGGDRSTINISASHHRHDGECVRAVYPKSNTAPRPESEIEYKYVDLGLSVKWATCNLGASSPEEYGDYYAWGEISSKDRFSWENYKFGTSGSFTKYNILDNRTELDAEDDAVASKLGGEWRMPTHEEELELVDNCTWVQTSINGINGYEITGPNGNSIFMPFGGMYDPTDYGTETSVYDANYGGWYWSSTLNNVGSSYAQGLCFFPSILKNVSDHERCDGHLIRPVFGVSAGSSSSLNVVDLSATGTANCYIVSKGGSYKFKTTKGNSNESIGKVKGVKVLWESFGTSAVPQVGDIVKVNPKYSDGYITFSTNDKYQEGNAVIAAYSDAACSDGNVLWSWHIWCTDQPQEQVYGNNAGIMMDRNIGATSATPGDIKALGLLYQWGRKDPFLSGSSISCYGTTASSTITWPMAEAVQNHLANNTAIDYAISHPSTYIISKNDNEDWYCINTAYSNNELWSSKKTMYDPCPEGWRVPDGGDNGVWAIAKGSPSTFSPVFASGNRGYDYSGHFGSDNHIWYPAAGCRNGDSNNLVSVGWLGYSWSSTAKDNKLVYILGSNAGNCSIPCDAYPRTHGGSVRCCKETSSSSDAPHWNGFTVESISDNTKIAKHKSWNFKSENAGDLFYSKDARNWTIWNYDVEIPLSKGEKLFLKGNKAFYGDVCQIEVIEGSAIGYGYISSLFDNSDSSFTTTSFPDRSMNSLFLGDISVSLSFPKGVTNLGTTYIYSYPFQSDGTITSISLPNTIELIGCTCFEGALITEIVIPKSVKFIGSAAFHCCSKLERVFFTGTVAEWNAISKGNYRWSEYNPEEKIPAKTVICTDGEAIF